MKATVNWKYETDKEPSATAKFAVAAGDIKLRATVSDATILKKVPSLEEFVLALEKPHAFNIDYHVLKQDCHFKFMNTISVLEKPLKLSYKHELCNKSTDLHGTLDLDNDNKVSADCTLGSKSKCKLKYTRNLNKGLTTLKPSYEVVHNCWDFSVSHKLYDINTFKASYKSSNNNLGLKWSLASQHNGILKASYHTSSKILGLKWLLNSKPHGSFEIKASLNVEEKLKIPNIMAKTTFNFEI